MATTVNKSKLVNQLFSSLGRSGKTRDAAPRLVVEQFIYALCRETSTRESADNAFSALSEKFFDWNEIRVSSVREVADVLDEFLDDGEPRAQRIIDFLQEVFETTFSFDLESLQKKPYKQAAKQLTRFQAASDFAVSWVVQQSLGGHAMPLDACALRVLRRLGILDEGDSDLETLRASLEHQIPKAKGTEFLDIVSGLAAEHCWEEDPACPVCPLRKTCPTGLEMKTSVVTTTKKSR